MTGAPLLQLAVAVTVRLCAKAVSATTPWKTTAATPVRNSEAVFLNADRLSSVQLNSDLIFISLSLSRLNARHAGDPNPDRSNSTESATEAVGKPVSDTVE
jgi:hypothetical protein